MNAKTINSIPFLFIFLLCPLAQADSHKITNGIYVITDSGKGPAVRTLNGIEVHLGGKFTEPIEKIYFRSISNDNESYFLSLEKTGPFPKDYTLFALYADGHCLRFNGSGSSDDKIFSISGQFDSAKAADAFAQFLKIQPLKRVRLDYALATGYISPKEAFSTKEPLPVTLEIKNIGSVPVTFQIGGKNRGERDNQFGFTAYDGMKAVPDTGNPVHFGGISVNQTLKPGEVFTKEVDLRKWFTFQKTGTYEITGTYDLSFFDPERKDYFVLWEDYATARFYLKIE